MAKTSMRKPLCENMYDGTLLQKQLTQKLSQKNPVPTDV